MRDVNYMAIIIV